LGAKICHAQFLSFCGMDPPKSAHRRSRIAKKREKSAEKCKNMPNINKKWKNRLISLNNWQNIDKKANF